MLNTMQHNWVQALSNRSSAIPDDLRGENSITRFEIYRATLFDNMGNALADTYPVVKKLVGEKFFQVMARRYIAQYPSRHGDIHAYGENFASFIHEFEPARELMYLADVARLEWLVHKAFHAGDAEVLMIDVLVDLSGQQLADLSLSLHPGLQLMQADYPVHAIWRMNQDSYDDTDSIDIHSGGCHLLVFRQQLDIVLLPLSLTDYQFVQNLMSVKKLALACEYTLKKNAGFDMAGILHSLFAQQLIVNE